MRQMIKEIANDVLLDFSPDIVKWNELEKIICMDFLCLRINVVINEVFDSQWDTIGLWDEIGNLFINWIIVLNWRLIFKWVMRHVSHTNWSNVAWTV